MKHKKPDTCPLCGKPLNCGMAITLYFYSNKNYGAVLTPITIPKKQKPKFRLIRDKGG
jgi:hypothetical protein